MITSQQVTPGMTISVEGKVYRVESCVKVTVAKGTPFIKMKLKSLMTEEVVEKNFKTGQSIEDVSLAERKLEYLYLEGKDYLFLDIGNLEQILIPAPIVGDKVNFLKEGTEIKAMFYGDSVFSLELPQFLELMVLKADAPEISLSGSHSTKFAILETGAKVSVPLFIESGDIVKIDTHTNEYVQRL